MEKFKEAVDEFTREWNYERKTGSIASTWEFSTSEENFKEKIDYLNQQTVTDGMWVMFHCDTCKGHDEEAPYHVTIIDHYCDSTLRERIGDERMKHLNMEMHAESLAKEIERKEYYPKGTLKALVKLVEQLSDNPEAFDAYRQATLLQDHIDGLSDDVEYHASEINKMLDPVDVKWLETKDIAIDQNGLSKCNMFSSVNRGCVAWVDLREFTQIKGKRVRVSLGLIEGDS